MSAISVTSVNVLDNPSKVTNPLQFEIQYECMFDLADGAPAAAPHAAVLRCRLRAAERPLPGTHTLPSASPSAYTLIINPSSQQHSGCAAVTQPLLPSSAQPPLPSLLPTRPCLQTSSGS